MSFYECQFPSGLQLGRAFLKSCGHIFLANCLLLFVFSAHGDLVPEAELIRPKNLHLLNEKRIHRVLDAMAQDLLDEEAALGKGSRKKKNALLLWDLLFNLERANAATQKYCVHNAMFAYVESGCVESEGYSFDLKESEVIKDLKTSGLDISCPSGQEPCGIIAGLTSTPGLICTSSGTRGCITEGRRNGTIDRLAKTIAGCMKADEGLHEEVRIGLKNSSPSVPCKPVFNAFLSQYSKFQQYCETEARARQQERALANVCHHSFRTAHEIWEEVQREKHGVPNLEDAICFFSQREEKSTYLCEKNNYGELDRFIQSFGDILKGKIGCRPTQEEITESPPPSTLLLPEQWEEARICTQRDPLNLRAERSTEGEPLTQIPKGTSVQINDLGQEFRPWVEVKFGTQRGFVHGRYVCHRDTEESTSSQNAEPRTTDVEPLSPAAGGPLSSYDYVDKSKCDHRDFAGQYIDPTNGNRKTWLDACFAADGTSMKLCMDMTCPNTGKFQRAIFKSTYDPDGPYQLLPAPEGYDEGIQLVRKVKELQDKGVCVSQITNWHRPARYNESVGGRQKSYHKIEGGYKAIDILLCDHSAKQKAAQLLAGWPGGLGVYHNSSTIHIDLRGYSARW